MKFIKTLLIAFLVTSCASTPGFPAAVIFSGNDVKALKANLNLNDAAHVRTGSAEPTSSAVSAPLGSIYISTTTGLIYRKLDSGSSTNWETIGSASGGSFNLITNPGAETNTNGWTASGGTFARTTTAANVGFGVGAFSWTPSGAQNVRTDAYTIPAGLYGRNCIGKFVYKGGDSNYTIQVLDGSNNVLAFEAMVASTNYVKQIVTFTCPTSGSLKLGLLASGSATQIFWDTAFLGETDQVDQSEAATLDSSNWYVEAKVTASTDISLSTSNTGYVTANNSSMTLTTTGGSSAAEIACASGTAGTGSTCTAADENMGIEFIVPKAGYYEACVWISHNLEAPASAGGRGNWKLAETSTTSHTITTDASRFYFYRIQSTAASGLSNTNFPRLICNTFNFASAGEKAIRLYYNLTTTNAISANLIEMDAGVTDPNALIWTVRPVTNNFPLPVLVGSISSLTTGTKRIESADVASAGTVAETGSADWINGSCAVASSVYTCTLQSGVFTAAPACTTAVNGTAAAFAVVESTSTTTVVVRTFNSAGSAADQSFHIICDGAK